MIQSSELRIGNWVMWQGIPVKIATLTSFERTFNKIKEGRASGIPLTPEILEKAGFECYGVYPDGFSSYIKKGVEVYLPYFEFCYSDSDYKIEIKYLHQLQNLYRCLCGEELDIDF